MGCLRAAGHERSLRQTLAAQMRYPYFPVTIDQLEGGINYHELVEGVFDIDDVVVRTQYLNHPALTLAYRLECDGSTVCYVADHEPFDPALGGAATCGRTAMTIDMSRSWRAPTS